MKGVDLVKYTVIKGFYKYTAEVSIYLPKTIHLVYNNGYIGNYCTNGHNHYIGFIKYNVKLFKELKSKNRDASIFKFDDLILIIIDNILDNNNVLPTYTYLEMMSEFNLDNYFIVYKKPDLYTLKNNTDLLKLEWIQIQTEHIYQIIRIKEITGPYSALGFRICIESSFPSTSSKPYYMMEEWFIDDLVKTCLFYGTKLNVSIHKNYWDEYNKLRDIVLSKI